MSDQFVSSRMRGMVVKLELKSSNCTQWEARYGFHVESGGRGDYIKHFDRGKKTYGSSMKCFFLFLFFFFFFLVNCTRSIHIGKTFCPLHLFMAGHFVLYSCWVISFIAFVFPTGVSYRWWPWRNSVNLWLWGIINLIVMPITRGGLFLTFLLIL